VVAPSTPNPPARLTAATTSRQWLKASSGNSMPSIAQIGDFMVVLTPRRLPARLLIAWLANVQATLAHPRRSCQASSSWGENGVALFSHCERRRSNPALALYYKLEGLVAKSSSP
jgi:hypothetical protein